jgi:hypothetical protein
MRVFENRVLRRIFGPMWNEVTGRCRKLHNELLVGIIPWLPKQQPVIILTEVYWLSNKNGQQ